MKIGRTLYVKDRRAWRAWLRAQHARRPEIWLVYYKKSSGKPSIPYGDAVEEALCYGWIDSTMKSIDAERFAQRFTPRRPGSELSALNKERIRRMMKARKMTRIGFARIEHAFQEHKTKKMERFTLAPDLLKALKKDPETWKNFRAFPESYRRIRIGYLEASRQRPRAFRSRLLYFLKMTEKNKRFGMLR